MKYIKGVNRHGSEFILTIKKNRKTNTILSIEKTSTTVKGIGSLVSEYEGMKWYNKRSKHKILSKLTQFTETYQKLAITPNDGFFHIDSKVPYIKLKYFLDLTIDHYIETWSEYKNLPFAPIHGDLSLVGNVMFNKNNDVLFVDWEQFHIFEKIPTGFDAIMIIMENIYYEELRYKKIKFDVLKHVLILFKRLKQEKLISIKLIDNPLRKVSNFIASNKQIWNGQHFKLPSLKLSERIIDYVDTALKEST